MHVKACVVHAARAVRKRRLLLERPRSNTFVERMSCLLCGKDGAVTDGVCGDTRPFCLPPLSVISPGSSTAEHSRKQPPKDEFEIHPSQYTTFRSGYIRRVFYYCCVVKYGVYVGEKSIFSPPILLSWRSKSVPCLHPEHMCWRAGPCKAE